MVPKNKITTIKISKKFKEFLDKNVTHKSETYEDIIKKLLRCKNLSKKQKTELNC